MTAHKSKPTITPERVAWFANYYRREPAWGVFHVTLDDGNWTSPTQLWDEPVAYDVEEAVAYLNSLTPSQRRRLCRKAKDMARGIAKDMARGIAKDMARGIAKGISTP